MQASLTFRITYFTAATIHLQISPVDQFYSVTYHPDMSEPVLIEELPMPPELGRMFEQARRNRQWFNEHVEELEVYKRYRGRYVAAAGGELFVADTPQELERLVRASHPDDVPHVRYIPREKQSRIYACQR